MSRLGFHDGAAAKHGGIGLNPRLAGCGKRPSAPAFPLCNLPQRGRTKHSRSRKAERANESARCESKREETAFIAGCRKTFRKSNRFFRTLPGIAFQHVKYRLRACVAQPVTPATSGFTNGRLLHFPA